MRFQKPRWLKNASTWMPKDAMTGSKSPPRTPRQDMPRRHHDARAHGRRRGGESQQPNGPRWVSRPPWGPQLWNRSSWMSWCWLMLLWWESFVSELMLFSFWGSDIYCLFFKVWVWNIYLKVDVIGPFTTSTWMRLTCCSASKTFLRDTLPTFSLLEISYHV